MEKLEETVKKVLLKKEASNKEEKMYSGLVLLEDKNYKGYTSIKYWM